MTQFNFEVLTNAPLARIETAALGVDGLVASRFTSDYDLGKAVKLSTSQNYILAAQDDDIEGVVVAVNPATVNDGFSLGSVQRDRRIYAVVGANQAGALAVGAMVVADAQIALGTAGICQVKAGAGSIYLWRVVRHVTGTGVTGDKVIIERV